MKESPVDLFEAFKAYPDIEKVIIIKSDLLRLGTGISPSALAGARKNPDLRIKEYNIFSYDSTRKGVVAGDSMPGGIFLKDGTSDGTAVQLRMSENTPYLIDYKDGAFVLLWNNEKVAEILQFEEQAAYYNRYFEDGTPYQAYVFSVGRDHLQITANKHCEYFSKGKQCLFCELTPFAAAQKKGGEKMVLRKQAEKVAEVLYAGFQEKRFRHMLINGGTFLSPYQGKTEIEWYADFLETIRKRLWTWYPSCLQISALDDEGWKRIHDTGIPCIEPNIEVWGKELFSIVCPGKNEAFGFDNWIKRTINAVKFWGPGNVNPSFVAGVEMAQPFGFKSFEAAVKHTLGGHDFLMGNGVLPRQGGFLCIETGSKLAGNAPPPLEFYLELGRGYLELRYKHGFEHLFNAHCRHCLNHGTEFDFEYFHGHSSASREAEKKSTPPVP
ncbi:MAG: hypothetical protein JXA46_12970 [Dehalococcoidales bacterium]|nr:hypothetical protein [Dehalococcoidales bacterium]